VDAPIPDAADSGASQRPPRLHGLYGGAGKFCRVFRSRSVASAAFARSAAAPSCKKGDAVDMLFLATLAVFLALTLALIAGCAALERRK
jgi:hypothetical protein